MALDIHIHKGKKKKPAVILIHGLGMDKDIWLNPLSTKIFAKNVPLKVFATTKPKPRVSLKGTKITLGKYPEDVRHVWNSLEVEGFNLVCWSQKRPVGPIITAVKELAYIIRETELFFPKTPIALVGHSRGGLIARKFMERKNPVIKALVTISTPHAGSSIATLGKYLKPLSRSLKSILPENTHTIISETIKNVYNLLEGKALQELLPGAAFLKNLKDSYQKDVRYVSLGGTRPRLFTIYVWRKSGKKIYPGPLLSVPDSLFKLFPHSLIPDEIAPGKGDGLVSAKSSVLPWASRHCNLPVNHLSILWNKAAINRIMNTLSMV
jgi:pimeloyl-ACP methyl ester carboxylesterase